MMLDVNTDKMREGFWKTLPVAGTVGAVVVLELAAVIWHRFNTVKAVDVPATPATYNNTKALGTLLYTEYLFAFEVAAVILLVAIVAAIALTLRRRKDVRYNDPSAAVKTRREDRIRLVKMPASARPDSATEASPPTRAP
jgi:NADH-quinone oxidoreductase subunit J